MNVSRLNVRHDATKHMSPALLIGRIATLLLCWFGLLTTGPAHADFLQDIINGTNKNMSTWPSANSGAQMCSASPSGPTCSSTGVASQSTSAGNTGVGNPINVTNGNKYQIEVDMPALPGELGLEVVRHYNSAQASVPTQVGTGWRLSYDTRLYRVGHTVQILQADGTRHIFNIDPKDASLCASTDPTLGRVHIQGREQQTLYRWEWTHGPQAGKTLTFNAVGQLQSITAASGATLTLQYGFNGQLITVIDPQGRRLDIMARPQGELKQARSTPRTQQAAIFAGTARIKTPLGDITYSYGSACTPDASKARVIACASNLVSVNLPGGQQRLYSYDNPRWPSALTAIATRAPGQSEPTRIRQWRYNDQGQAIAGSPNNGDASQARIHSEIIKPALPNQMGTTWVHWKTSADDTEHEALYDSRIIAGRYQLVRALGERCEACSPTNVAYRYNDAGQLTEIIQLKPVRVKGAKAQGQAQDQGRPQASVRHTLDAQGRTTRIERLTFKAGQPHTRSLIERREYADQRWPDKPTLIAKPSVVADQEYQLHISYNDAGQTTELTESGYSPLRLDWDRQHALKAQHPSSANATPIQRTQRWRYQRILGISRLVEHDGPLPNGPMASPQDSDITRYSWDAKGQRIDTITQAGNRVSHLRYTAQGWVSQVSNDQGLRTDIAYDTVGRVIKRTRHAPGWSQPLEQDIKRNAQGLPEQLLVARRPWLNWAASWSEDQHLQWWVSAQGQWVQWGDGEQPFATSAATPRVQAADRISAAPTQSQTSPRAQTNTHPQTPRTPNSLMIVQRDDFGRVVSRQSADHGQTVMDYDEANRLVAMCDALRNCASYGYDVQDRILRQEAFASVSSESADPTGARPLLTTWQYQGPHLVAVRHPTMDETYEYDPRGLRSARVQHLHTAQGDFTAVTRYEHDENGLLINTALPDGSRIHHQRDGLGRTTALTRQRVQTPWLAVLAPEQVLAKDMAYDMRGLARYTAGNGIQSEWQRSQGRDSYGMLARMVHKRVKEPPQSKPALIAKRSAEQAASLLLGVTPAHAQEQPTIASLNGTTTTEPSGGTSASMLDAGVLLDRQYLWSTTGPLLLTRATRLGELEQQANAYDGQGQLVASVRALARALNQGQTPSAPPNTGRNLDDHADSSTWQQQAVWRYAYDQQQRRVLAQQGVSQQNDMGNTQQLVYAPHSHRLLKASPEVLGDGSRSAPDEAPYDASGQAVQWRGTNQVDGSQIVGTTAAAPDTRLRLHWDALGRLERVSQATDNNAQREQPTLARYSYDHRGLRIAKTVFGPIGQSHSAQTALATSNTTSTAARTSTRTTLTTYDQSRRPQLELDSSGRIRRIYVWLSDTQPLAVIDEQGAGAQLAALHPSWWQDAGQAFSDMGLLARLWWGQVMGDGVGQTAGERSAWVQVNHLGAPEFVTDGRAQVIWQAHYAPFGAAAVKTRIGFVLNLRLPGQQHDAETGWTFNRHRYYDPQAGQYLSPDPLGKPDGANPYAYVANNPLLYIDPDGLVLFAFDGTGNTNDAQWQLDHGAKNSNVVLFSDAYDKTSQVKYVTGVGTNHAGRDTYGDILTAAFTSKPLTFIPDEGGNYSGPTRIERMQLYFDDTADSILNDDEVMQVDIVGFSRGAAEARDFANRIVAATNNGVYRYQRHNEKGLLMFDTAGDPVMACQVVNFRFMGLFDTVLSTNFSKYNYQMAIPDEFAYVAQAVALNEYRSAPAGVDAFWSAPAMNFTMWGRTRVHLTDNEHYGGFPLESIGGSLGLPGKTRVELGFIGAHSDIGGGYGDDSGLSTVALSWMVGQAQLAGVTMKTQTIAITSEEKAALHDQSNVIRFGNPTSAPKEFEVEEWGCTPPAEGTWSRPDNNPCHVTYDTEDRNVNGAFSGTTQRAMGFGGLDANGNGSMVNADTHQFITYTARDTKKDRRTTDEIAHSLGNDAMIKNQTGTVDVQAYVNWLKNHGYTFTRYGEW